MNRRGKIRISGGEEVTLGAFNHFAWIKNHLVFNFFNTLDKKGVSFYHGFIFLLQQPIGLYSIIYNDVSVAVEGSDLIW